MVVMPGRNRIIQIIKKQLWEEPLSAKEADILESWLKKSAANQRTWENCTDSEKILNNLQQANFIDLNDSWKKIESQLQTAYDHNLLKEIIFRRTLLAAALIGLILSIIG